MQDPHTGDMHKINKDMADALGELKRERNLSSEDAPSPPDWPVMHEGQVVSVEGGKFRISHIGKRKIVLRGVPHDTPLG